MTNQEMLNYTFSTILGVSIDDCIEGLNAESIPSWDSVAHMTLVTELEEKFNVTFDFNQISEIMSYAKVKETLISLGIHF